MRAAPLAGAGPGSAAGGPVRPRLDIRPFGLPFRSLVRREVRRFIVFGVEAVLGHVFQVSIYLTLFILALGDARATPEGAAVLDHLVPGLVILTVMTKAFEQPGFSLLFDKIEGTAAELLTSPLAAFELVAGYALAGLAAGLTTAAMVLGVLALIWPVSVTHPLAILWFAAWSGLMMAMAGVIVALWADKWDHIAAAIGFLVIPLVGISGIFVPVDAFPAWLAAIALSSPVVYLVDGFRMGFGGEPTFDPLVSLALGPLATAVIALAAWALVRSGYKLRP